MKLSENMKSHLRIAASQKIAAHTFPGAYGETVCRGFGVHQRTLEALEKRGLLERHGKTCLDTYRITLDGVEYVKNYICAELASHQNSAITSIEHTIYPGLLSMAQSRLAGVETLRKL